jgi:hypothetical protein
MEVCLLVLAIALFVVSAFFYGYQTGTGSVNLPIYPYQGYGLTFLGFGSILMITASISYTKRSKNSFNASHL